MVTASMASPVKKRGALPRALMTGLVYGLAGFALNWFKVEIFFNVDFLFGSIVTMFALMRFGVVTGVTAAFVAAACTWFHWHHPWAIVIFTAEALCTAMFHRKRNWDAVVNNIAFWFSGGLLLVLSFYQLVMGFPFVTAILMALKQGVNGITNTLIAAALYGVYCVYRQQPGKLPSLRQLLFLAISLAVIIPGFVFLYLDIRHTLAKDLTNRQNDAVQTANAVQGGLSTWFSRSQGFLRYLASTSNREPSSLVQGNLDALRHNMPEFVRLGIVDAQAITKAFSPARDDTGASTLGLDLSGRPYLTAVETAPHPFVTQMFHGKIGKTGPRLILVAPVLAGERYRGAVFGVAELGAVKEILTRSALDGDVVVTLVDNNGIVVTSTSETRRPLDRFALPDKGTLLPISNGVSHWIPNPQPGIGPAKRWMSSFYLEALPIPSLPGWRVVVEAPLKPTLALISHQIALEMAGLGGLLVLIVFLSRLVAKRITAAISDFERITSQLPERIAAGASIAWPKPASLELQGLTVNLQEMSETLWQSHDELRTLNATLEERVEKRTEELSDQRRRLSDIIVGTNNGTWEWNVQTGAMMLNERWADIVGYRLAELHPVSVATWRELAHPDDLKLSDELVAWHMSGELNSYLCECRMKHKDGGWVWVLAQGKVVSWTDDGKPLMMSGTHHEITNRKKTEQALRDSQELLELERSLLRTVISTIPDLVFLKDPNGVFLICNPAVERVFCLPQSEIIGKTDHDIWPSDLADAFELRDAQIMAEGRPLTTDEWVGDKTDGHAILFETKKTPMYDRSGKLLGILAVARDMTLVHEAKEELQRRLALQERLKIIADTAPGALFEYHWGPEGTGCFPYVSASVAEIWGFEPEAVASDGTRFWELVHPEDRPKLERALSESDQVNEPIACEFRMLAPKGELWIKIAAVPMKTDQGGLIWFGFISDTTVNKKAEIVLRESEGALKKAVAMRTADLRRLAERIENVAEQERSAIAQEIHDELGQLLAALMMDVAWFQKKVPDGDLKFAQKLCAMNDLLGITIDCARRITRNLRPRVLDELGLVAAVEAQLELFRERHIECRIEIPRRDIEVDPERSSSLFRIFQESMTNVMRHSEASRATILLDISREVITLEVADNGRGITAAESERMESLGLLGIRERAFRWGGDASIKGAPNEGTVVRVTIPMERSLS